MPDNITTYNVSDLRTIPLRHPYRWAAAAVVVVLMLLLVRGAASNPKLQWDLVAHYLFDRQIMSGLLQTCLLTVTIMIVAILVGGVAALMVLSPSSLLSIPAKGFIWFFRGAPALVQLIVWYNLSLFVERIELTVPGLGTLISVSTNDVMTPYVAAVLALGLHEAGYMAEIIRNGIQSVGRGQTEAALCLGMKPSRLMFRIIIPQAMRVIIPPTGNETINLLKTTSLVSTIAVADLLYTAQAIYSRTFETIPLLIVVTIWYLVVVTLMSIGQYYLERRYSRDENARNASLSDITAAFLFRFRREVPAK
ncbi:amino acid ABC transporter permease [Rhizobium miluonense]|uniref:Polar amino acid transport system permease protein n=1 Tax=Rhizobium miluonense TaxID=411945 RepID=A0A1C3V5J9_9HYPH|nr:amino acid ABC transporter permease [Rhizobium miluonense]SCB22993.1 polar amino acid transport system permease protein [Rhizobium miluonense]